MLDVHPAQHAAGNWREFLIHIATIVLGLLIAVGLEQTVEYVHHRRELTEARRELREEKEANVRGFRESEAAVRASEPYLMEYLANLRRSIQDPAVPVEKLNVPFGFVYSQYTAWTAAQRDGGLTLMPAAEQSANDRLYVGLHALDKAEDEAYLSLEHAQAVFLSGLSPRELTLEQKMELYRDLSKALADLRLVRVVLRLTVRFNPELGQAPGGDRAM